MKWVEIFREENPDDPRNWSNLGSMVCWHKRYCLGDKHDFKNPEDFRKYVKDKGNNNFIILPLYLYDHSGLAISTRRIYPFDDPWDAGQVGWIYVEKDVAKQEFDENYSKEKILEVLEKEVEVYNNYLCGNVYGFCLWENGEEVDCCCGFYGYNPVENGMADNIGDNKAAEALKAAGTIYDGMIITLPDGKVYEDEEEMLKDKGLRKKTIYVKEDEE